MQNAATRSSRYSLLTVAQLVVSISGSLLSLLAAGLILFISSSNPSGSTGVNVSFSTGALTYWVLGFLFVLGIWSALVAIRKLKGNQPPELPDRLLRYSLYLIPIWIGIAIGSAFLFNLQNSGSALAPLILLLTLIPLVIVVGLGIEKQQHGTVQHFWGLVTGSIFVTMPISILVESVLLLLGLALMSVNLVTSNPDLYSSFLTFSQLESASQAQLQQLSSQVTPYLSSPLVIFGVVFGLCVLAPVVEEFLKPLMIWAFARRSLTPAQGFGMGLICGAAFALVESVFALQAANSASFVQLLLGRTGTSTLHIFCTGMMGWAIVSGWRDGNVWRTSLIYAGVVLTHGLWNFFALLMGYGALPITMPKSVESLASASPWILGLLFVWMVTILWVMKTRLLAQNPPPLVQLPVDSVSQDPA